MPTYINRDYSPDANVLQMGFQQRQQRAQNLASMIDQYGGIEAAGMANPGLLDDYMNSAGFSAGQRKNIIGRIQAGDVSAAQELKGLQQMAANQRLEMGQVQQQQPAPAPAPPNNPAVRTPATTGPIDYTPNPDNFTGAMNSSPLPDGTNAAIDQGVTRTSAIAGVPMDTPGVGTIGYQSWQNTPTLQDLTPAGSGPVSELPEVQGIKDASMEAAAGAYDEAAKVSNKVTEIMQDPRVLNNFTEYLQAEDKEFFRSGAYVKGKEFSAEEKAKEVLYNSLTKDQQIALGADNPTDFQKLDVANMPPATQELLGKITATFQQAEEQKIVQDKLVEETLNINPNAKTSGKNFAANSTMQRGERALDAVNGVEYSWNALGSNPNQIVQGLQYYERMKQNSPDMYYSLMPDKIGQELQKLQMEGKTSENTILKSEADKIRRRAGNPDYLKAIDDAELLETSARASLLAAQAGMASAQLQAALNGVPGGQDMLQLMELMFKGLNTQNMSDDNQKLFNNAFTEIMNKFQEQVDGKTYAEMLQGFFNVKTKVRYGEQGGSTSSAPVSQEYGDLYNIYASN